MTVLSVVCMELAFLIVLNSAIKDWQEVTQGPAGAPEFRMTTAGPRQLRSSYRVSVPSVRLHPKTFTG